MTQIKLIIAGSRNFNDYSLLVKEVDSFIHYLFTENEDRDFDIEIVSGGANGADKLGEKYAKEHNLATKQFIPDWSVGRGAGFLRNLEMARYATHCICFDLGTKGTGHMIKLAKEYNLGLKVIRL